MKAEVFDKLVVSIPTKAECRHVANLLSLWFNLIIVHFCVSPQCFLALGLKGENAHEEILDQFSLVGGDIRGRSNFWHYHS
jgi:hypothetical protein